MPTKPQSHVSHDFAARIKRIGDARTELYNRGFTHGVLVALAGVALVAWLICEGGAA